MNRKTKITCLSLLAATIVLSSCADPASQLPEYGSVPPFEMTDSQGHSFQGKSLLGKVWIADFIYTTCPAECPMMTAKMHSVAKKVSREDDVRLVSISVDPDHDTPPVLHAFASRFGGPTSQWIFLTGSPASVHELAYTTFHVGDVISKMTHNTKFALVDKRGHIRGYYSSLGEDDLPKMMTDLAALRHASS